MRLAIASTFTCDPIESGLKFWGDKFGNRVAINFSPYDQVFQELLDLDSTLNHPENNARILLIRFEDWIRNLNNSEKSDFHTHIVNNILYLSEYAATSASLRNTPLLVVITRNSTHSLIKPEQQREYERLIRNSLSEHSNIFVISSADIDKKYSVENYYDPQRDQLGHIPFTGDYFTALASTVFRNVIAIKRKPYKVIVLDCDNTLWGGACGELGAKGIHFSDSFLNLQLFILQQLRSGKILCLCSKNVKEDVDEVFAVRKDMLLRDEDIVSSKINWLPKSQNIRELAGELNLGLDSFIFLDDNPIECAEVRANCPEVLTLNLPQNPEEIPTFLDHIWPFDSLKTTNEDKARTKLYQDNIKRSTFKKGSSSLKDFIDGLNLEITINHPSPNDISRVSQLTYRTNQFNFTTIRRSEEEIKELLRKDDFECKVCSVKDRFGDYGLVGALLYQKLPDRFLLDSFMLSCRVLGRGVEHKMLKFIGETANKESFDSVQINFRRTEKNLPALSFLESIIKDFSGDIPFDENGYILPSMYLSSLVYNPDRSTSEQSSSNSKKKESTSNPSDEADSLIYEEIAKNLNSAAGINQHLFSNGQSAGNKSISPASPSEEKDSIDTISEIWEKIIDKTGIGPDEHFFDVGGTSLKAVEVLSQLNQQFNKNLTIVSLFEHSTIRSLAELVDGMPVENHEFSKILQRAGSRRDRIRRKN